MAVLHDEGLSMFHWDYFKFGALKCFVHRWKAG